VTRYVLLYTSAGDVAAKAPPVYPRHLARIREFAGRGLLAVGTFGDPQTQGAMGIFATREAAEEFVAGDPFRLEGVIESYEIREWTDILA
jgi:uncharacterized protein